MVAKRRFERPIREAIDRRMAKVMAEVHAWGMLPVVLVAVNPDDPARPAVIPCGPGLTAADVARLLKALAGAQLERVDPITEGEG